MDDSCDESGLLALIGGGGDGDCGGNGGGGGGVDEAALKKGPWTAAEDAILVDYVKKHGEGNWNAVQKRTGLARCGKSCRLRWANHLRPNLKKGAFSPQEEKLILELHAQFGNKWARMATLLPGRTDNEIKNYWNTRVKRRQRQGLPLYSDDPDHSKPTTSTAPPTPTNAAEFEFFQQNQQHQHQHHHPPLSPTPSPHSSLPLSSFTFQHRPTPLLCNPLGFKRYRTSVPFTPISTSALTTQLANFDGFRFPDSVQFNSAVTSSQISSSSSVFPSTLELPSNQFSSQPQFADMEFKDPALYNINTNGLLEDLLFEAQSLASGSGHDPKKRSYLSLYEGNGVFDDFPLASVYCSSTSGLKPKEEAPDLSQSMNEDLSTLLSVMPSTMQVPDWHNNSAAEVSSIQSSGVMTDDNFGIDTKPLASLFPLTNTTNHNENPGCYFWDNLPGLC